MGPDDAMQNFFVRLALAAVFLAGCSADSSSQFQGYIEGEYVYVAAPLGGALTNLAVARGDRSRPGNCCFDWSAVPRPPPSGRRKKIWRRQRPALARCSEAAILPRAPSNLRDDPGASILRPRNWIRPGRNATPTSGRRSPRKPPRSTRRTGRSTRSNSLRRPMRSCRTRCIAQGEWVAAGNPSSSAAAAGQSQGAVFRAGDGPAENQNRRNRQRDVRRRGASVFRDVNYISTQAEFTPPVIYNRENRAKLVYMIEAKFSPADAADLRPGQPVDVKLSL